MLTLSCLARSDDTIDKSDPFINSDGVDDGFDSSPCSSHGKHESRNLIFLYEMVENVM